MENKDKPAFPTIRDILNNPQFGTVEGLTKREYFAVMAMQGMLIRTGFKTQSFVGRIRQFFGLHGYGIIYEYNFNEIVKMSTQIAELQIAELERTNQSE